MPIVRKTFYSLVGKRFLDIMICSFAIIILSPLFFFLSILEFFIHGRPILYKQERVGKNEKKFHIYKFRSMTNKKDHNGNLLPNEKRLTNFGRFIRRFSLDELPELFCIVKGDMSIIGPRPLLVEYLPYYNEKHRIRHEVRPGLACVPLHPIKTWTWNDQFENDIWYIEHCSFIVDVRMVFAVIKEAIVGSEYRVDGVRESFNGDNLYFDAKSNENTHKS